MRLNLKFIGLVISAILTILMFYLLRIESIKESISCFSYEIGTNPQHLSLLLKIFLSVGLIIGAMGSINGIGTLFVASIFSIFIGKDFYFVVLFFSFIASVFAVLVRLLIFIILDLIDKYIMRLNPV